MLMQIKLTKGEETKFAICVSPIKYSVIVGLETRHHELLMKAWSAQMTGGVQE